MKKKMIDAVLLAQAKALFARRSAVDSIAAALVAPDGDSSGKSWYKILNAKEDEAEILIYSEIGMWGINAQDFIEDLREIDAKVINVRINSGGGSVFEGLAIYNALASHKSKIIVHIDALAASIASVIAMSGDKIIISEVGQVMIHPPHSYCIGFADDMRKEAEILDSIQEAIVDVYVARTGGDRKKIEKWVKEETWFKGSVAVSEGFADETSKLKVADPPKASAHLPIDFYVAMFPNMPADVKASLIIGVNSNNCILKQKAETQDTDKLDFSNMTKRTYEAFLRAHGATRKQATDLTLNGIKVARDEPPERTDPSPRDEDAGAAEAIKTILRMAESLQTVVAINAMTSKLRK